MPCVPSEVEFDGGYAVVCSNFSPTPPDGRYVCYVGPTGTTADTQGWGVWEGEYQARGNTQRIVHVTSGVCTIVTPPMEVGTGYIVLIEGDPTDSRTTGSSATTSTLDVRNKLHKSKRFRYRQNLLPFWSTGPRRIDEEPLQ